MRGTGKEYAVALYELSGENGCIDAAHRDLLYVKEVFEATGDLVSFLRSPAVDRSVREETLCGALEGEVHELVLSTLCALCRNGDIDALDECVEAFETLYDAERKTGRAVVTSAVPLTEDEKARLDQKLTQRFSRRFDYEYVIDPSLIGGLVVETDGMRLDGSLKARLKAMKGAMSQ